ncbi:MAG: hypothetical protein FVQ77_15065 [Cytophagales bacterium]|nr:hypothetical protein [Cytophagales bacterium]
MKIQSFNIKSAVGSRQSAVHNRKSAVHSRQSAVGSPQSAVGSPQSAVHPEYSGAVGNCFLPFCRLPIANC